jgi:hypothetical protein
MTPHTPIPDATARPMREPAHVCAACGAGDHEQVLLDAHCACPCHPAGNAAGEVSS